MSTSRAFEDEELHLGITVQCQAEMVTGSGGSRMGAEHPNPPVTFR
jgi:hypothetical protein